LNAPSEAVGRRNSLQEIALFIQVNRRSPNGPLPALWLLGIPIPILILIWAFGGLH
jgi:hypothetical protein